MANEQDKVTPNESYEFNSFYTTGESSQFFGMDIFDMYDADEISAMVKEPIIHNRELRKLSNQLYSANGLAHVHPRALRRRRPHLRWRHGLERLPHEGYPHLGLPWRG